MLNIWRSSNGCWNLSAGIHIGIQSTAHPISDGRACDDSHSPSSTGRQAGGLTSLRSLIIGAGQRTGSTGSEPEPVSVVRSPGAVQVHDVGDGAITVSSRGDDRLFVGLDEGVDGARPGVVEESAVMVDLRVPAAFAPIAESEPLRDADEGIETRRMHPVTTEIERLSRDKIRRVSTSPDAMRRLEKHERQTVRRGGRCSGKARRTRSHNDHVNLRGHASRLPKHARSGRRCRCPGRNFAPRAPSLGAGFDMHVPSIPNLRRIDPLLHPDWPVGT